MFTQIESNYKEMESKNYKFERNTFDLKPSIHENLLIFKLQTLLTGFNQLFYPKAKQLPIYITGHLSVSICEICWKLVSGGLLKLFGEFEEKHP